ncbi:MAG: EF-Tu/IF-2/RF-3 family GTPase, partial [Nitrospirota bacterium]
WFDNYQGVIVLVRLFDGEVKRGTKIMLMAAKKVLEVIEVGIFTPMKKPVDSLKAGEVGYIIAGIRDVTNTKIGDTITDAENPVSEPCAGYKDVKPMVFCGLYPTETNQYETLKNALEKLRLN